MLLTDTRDVSNLLGRAGFTLLTVDIDQIQVKYPSMWELVQDLQDMGESNAIVDRSVLTTEKPRIRTLLSFCPLKATNSTARYFTKCFVHLPA